MSEEKILYDKDGLKLIEDETGVSLHGYGMSYMGDFSGMLHRLTGGRLAHEMLAKVAKIKGEAVSADGRRLNAIDCTAGMGEDSIILAALGYEVTLCEQNPVVAALLRDAMRRGADNADHPELVEIISRMHLFEGDSIEYMKGLEEKPDLIYLDPMFPEKQKSSLTQKKLQLIQKLERPCSDENELLKAAMETGAPKIIIKRPLKGPFLADVKPGYQVKGKAIRFDVIVQTL